MAQRTSQAQIDVPRPPPMRRTYISELRLQHFRSFGEEARLKLCAGLNVIVGANGSGKSNCIDALLFGLAQEATRLRVRSWNELAHRARRGPTGVQLQFAYVDQQDAAGTDTQQLDAAELVLLSRVKQDGSRAITLAGKAITLQQTRDTLLDLGIDADGGFCVRQGVSGETISGPEVAQLLLQASGAARFNLSASAAELKLAHERTELDRVHRNIDVLEAANSEAQAKHDALAELRSLHHEKRKLCAHALTLAEALTKSRTALFEHQRAELQELIAEAQCSFENARLAIEQLDEVEANEEAKLDVARLELACARGAVDAAANDLSAAEASAVDAVFRRALCEMELRKSRTIMEDASAQKHEAHLTVIRLQTELAALHQSTIRVVAPGGPEATTQLEAELSEAKAAAVQKKESVHAAIVKLRYTIAKREATTARLAQAREAYTLSEASVLAARQSGGDMPRRLSELQTAREAHTVAVSTAKEASERLARYETAECATLCSSLKLAIDDPRLEGCLTALHCIASIHLGVRITQTAEEAMPLLDAARQRDEPIRVWPLDRLRSSDASPEHNVLKGQLGTRVCLPRELVTVEPGFEPVVSAAFGAYLIVQDDESGREVNSISKVPCVTLEGVVHERGKLTGGDRGETATFRWLWERQRANLSVQKAEAQKAIAAKAVSLLEELESKLADAAAEEKDASAQMWHADSSMQVSELLLSRARQAEADAARIEAMCAARLASVMPPNVSTQSGGVLSTKAGRDDSTPSSTDDARIAQVKLRLAAAEQALFDIEAAQPLRIEREDAELLLEIQDYESTVLRSVASIASLETSSLEAAKALIAAGEIVEEGTDALERARERRKGLQKDLRAAESSLKSLLNRRESLEKIGAATSEESTFVQSLAGQEEFSEEEDTHVGDEQGEEATNSSLASLPSAGDHHEQAAQTTTPATAADEFERIRKSFNEARAMLHECTLRREDIEAQHGSRQSLRSQLDDWASAHIEGLKECKRKEEVTRASIDSLVDGMKKMRGRVARANSAAFSAVRAHMRVLFSTLVPIMEVDITCADPTSPEKGVEVLVRSRRQGCQRQQSSPDEGNNDCSQRAEGDDEVRSDARDEGWRKGVAELSGGQRTLLKLSLLLAIAKHRPSTLLIVDEVDAALDEANTLKVAHILKELSRSTQVIAVSHRREMQVSADKILRLYKNEDVTTVS